jgi:hypothetical protein
MARADTQFKPGKGSGGNPKGRPPLPPELAGIKEMTADEVKRTIAGVCRMTVEKLYELKANTQAQAFTVAIASMLIKAIEKGDYTNVDFILNRTIGKLKEQSEVTLLTETVEALKEVPREDLVAYLKERQAA